MLVITAYKEWWATAIYRYRRPDGRRNVVAFIYHDATRFIVEEAFNTTGNRPTPYELITMGLSPMVDSLSIEGSLDG